MDQMNEQTVPNTGLSSAQDKSTNLELFYSDVLQNSNIMTTTDVFRYLSELPDFNAAEFAKPFREVDFDAVVASLSEQVLSSG